MVPVVPERLGWIRPTHKWISGMGALLTRSEQELSVGFTRGDSHENLSQSANARREVDIVTLERCICDVVYLGESQATTLV